jgi:hypothetical protein
MEIAITVTAIKNFKFHNKDLLESVGRLCTGRDSREAI